jgi:outer membrane receptor protein involved in Fe transport
MYQHQDISEHDKPLDPLLFLLYSSYKYEADAYNAELQHLFRWNFIKTVIGAGYFSVRSEENFTFVLDLPPPTAVPDRIKRDIDHTNIYLYSYINFPKNVTITAGASGDFLEGGDKDREQFNPKFGITWEPFSGTTLRGGVFRTLKRTLITNQTLEPTQVAGFNQFFDDWNGTRAWNYGGAVDQKLFKSLYAGGEYLFRDLDFVWLDRSTGFPVAREEKWKEYLGRGYLYWTPHKWVGLSAEYLYERFKREPEFSLGVKEVVTHRVPLGVNFFHPAGLSAVFKASYVNQHGSFERQTPFATGVFEHGDDQFWLFDIAISYRLPKRLGFISVGVKNLLNKHFKYFDPDYFNPSIIPDRFIYGKITLALP